MKKIIVVVLALGLGLMMGCGKEGDATPAKVENKGPTGTDALKPALIKTAMERWAKASGNTLEVQEEKDSGQVGWVGKYAVVTGKRKEMWRIMVSPVAKIIAGQVKKDPKNRVALVEGPKVGLVVTCAGVFENNRRSKCQDDMPKQLSDYIMLLTE